MPTVEPPSATSRPVYLFQYALPSDAPQVDALRIRAFQSANYLSVFDPEVLCSQNDPEGSLVLCAWDGEHLAASLRIAMAKDAAELEALLGVPGDYPDSCFPAVVPGRGAVCEQHRGRGLMPYLVTVSLIHARNIGAACAVATQASGTPHQHTMLKAGWTVSATGPYESTGVKVLTDTHLLKLDAALFDSAIETGLRSYLLRSQ